MSGQYDDIIRLPHPDSPKHPRMSLYDRAAQFSPFAALTGHSAAIAETGRLTDQRMELDEYEMARVDAEMKRRHGVHHLLCARRTEERRQLPNCHRRGQADRRGQRRDPDGGSTVYSHRGCFQHRDRPVRTP